MRATLASGSPFFLLSRSGNPAEEGGIAIREHLTTPCSGVQTLRAGGPVLGRVVQEEPARVWTPCARGGASVVGNPARELEFEETSHEQCSDVDG